jgi:hypothetical protein
MYLLRVKSYETGFYPGFCNTLTVAALRAAMLQAHS